MFPTCRENFSAGRLIELILAPGCLLLGVLLGAGCASATAPAEKPAPARLIVHNLTDYAWRLVLTERTSGAELAVAVAQRAERPIELAGGDYGIAQSIVTAESPGGLARKLTCRLENGQTYHWRLATLLSEKPPP